MWAISLILSMVGLLFSLLAIFSYSWVIFLPRLSIQTLYHLRAIRIAVATLAIALALLGWWLTPTIAQGIQLFLVILLTPLSGFIYAGKVLIAVNSPKHVIAEAAPLTSDAMVLGIELDSHTHAWSVETLFPHHLVNDELDRRPIVATWCTYCRNGIVYDAIVNGQRLTFVVESMWRRNMIMRDKETGSLWQQATGEALIGPLQGAHLNILGGELMNWSGWMAQHPQTTFALEPEKWEGMVPLSRLTLLLENIAKRFALPGIVPTDQRLPFDAEVIGVVAQGEAKAYPLDLLKMAGRIEDRLGDLSLRIDFDPKSNGVSVSQGTIPFPYQRTRWIGWYEFHPLTKLYQADEPASSLSGNPNWYTDSQDKHGF